MSSRVQRFEDQVSGRFQQVNKTSSATTPSQITTQNQNTMNDDPNAYLAANRDSSLTQDDSLNNMAPSFDQSLVNISATIEEEEKSISIDISPSLDPETKIQEVFNKYSGKQSDADITPHKFTALDQNSTGKK